MGYASTGVYKAFIPSDAIIQSNDSETNDGGSAIYVKVKEITITNDYIGASLFRFVFYLKSGNVGSTAYGKIYKNDIAIGTERTNNTVNYATFTEDISSTGWRAGDRIQLWTKGTAGWFGYSRNFRLEGTPTITTGDFYNSLT